MSIWRIASPPPGPGPPSQSLDLAPAGLRKSTLQGLHVFNKGSNHVSVVRRQGKHWSVPHGSRLRPPLRANYAVVSRRQNPRSREASVQPRSAKAWGALAGRQPLYKPCNETCKTVAFY
ncbi:hypothetical protein TgHK011_006232 [Trichoderma gracile]|nr:hypothetical protein TgHK011_006232 [Trichoderma gracile]